MITIKQVYDAYPENDLLPFAVDETWVLEDIEDEAAQPCGVADTLFLFLCRELCSAADVDECDPELAVSRCDRAIADIAAVRDALRMLPG